MCESFDFEFACMHGPSGCVFFKYKKELRARELFATLVSAKVPLKKNARRSPPSITSGRGIKQKHERIEQQFLF